MSDAYREMPDVLGEAERETAAVQAFGQWRDRTRMRVLLVFGLLGLVPGAIAYWLVQELQFEHNHGRALLLLNVAAAVAASGAMFAIGVVVARRIVRARTPQQIAALAKAYDLPPERIAQTATLVEHL